jgi:aspartyl-tRNA(Asn)/glutamyl-tRNA(Gln) amidotransferase subunit C
MAIDTKTAARVAHLARIRVDASDLPHLAGELNGIIAFMEQLNAVDVTGVEPMTSVTPMRLPLRADAVTDGGIRDRILANAPAARDGFFTVPKVVE